MEKLTLSLTCILVLSFLSFSCTKEHTYDCSVKLVARLNNPLIEETVQTKEEADAFCSRYAVGDVYGSSDINVISAIQDCNCVKITL